MTKLQTTVSVAAALVILGASALPAPAQTLDASNAACAVPFAPARALTQYPAERPVLGSALVYYPTGSAIVRIDLTEDGTPQNAAIVKSTGDYQLDEAAKQAALSQRFAAEIRDCHSVAGSYLYEVDYGN